MKEKEAGETRPASKKPREPKQKETKREKKRRRKERRNQKVSIIFFFFISMDLRRLIKAGLT